jgi:hypothetical protein
VLKELGKTDWLRMLNISTVHIPTVLILRGTRNLQAQYEIARGLFANVLEVGAPNGLIEYVSLPKNLSGLIFLALTTRSPDTALP